MRKNAQTHVRLFQGGILTLFPATAFEPLTQALQSGKKWWEGETLYGSTMLVRLSTVTDVHFTTAAAMELQRADDEEAQWEPA